MAATFGNVDGSGSSAGNAEKEGRFKSVDPRVKHFAPGTAPAFGHAKTVGQTKVQPQAPPALPQAPPPASQLQQGLPQKITQQPQQQQQIPPPVQPQAPLPEPQQAPVPQQPPIVQDVGPAEFANRVNTYLVSMSRSIYEPISWGEINPQNIPIPNTWLGPDGYRLALKNTLDNLSVAGTNNYSELLDIAFCLLFFIRDEVEQKLHGVPVYYELANVLTESTYRILWSVRESLSQGKDLTKTLKHVNTAWGFIIQIDTILGGARVNTPAPPPVPQPAFSENRKSMDQVLTELQSFKQKPSNLPPLPTFPAGF